MDATVTTLSPRQTFDDNMRPAQLLLQVYRLLDSSDVIITEGNMVTALRQLVGAAGDEELMLIYNEVFLGLVRESAQMARSHLRHAALCNLLRQSVVASCTALETYLPTLLRTNLPLMIRARGRDAVTKGDLDLGAQFRDLKFSLDEALRVMTEPHPEEFISTKILGMINFSYLSGNRGVAVAGKLLGLVDPWGAIAARLQGDTDVLQKTVKDTIERRNDIVHRADRRQNDPGGHQQPIAYSWTKQAVDTIDHVCTALDELVTMRVAEISAMITG